MGGFLWCVHACVCVCVCVCVRVCVCVLKGKYQFSEWLTSLYKFVHINSFYSEKDILMRRSTVMSIPLQ